MLGAKVSFKNLCCIIAVCVAGLSAEVSHAQGTAEVRVIGVASNDLLNVRRGAGTNFEVIGQLANGDRVRRLECRDQGNSRWCLIEMMTDMREQGWVNARYLSQATVAATQPDFADGLAGGPDYWEVYGVSGSLNVRARPSTNAPVLIGLLPGTVVQNLGCRRNEGRVWCQVSQIGGGVTGWTANQFLREAAAPSVAPNAAPASQAEQACLRAVSTETNNPDVEVVESLFSEAGTLVTVAVGPQGAPWQCVAYSDGSTSRPMSMGN